MNQLGGDADMVESEEDQGTVSYWFFNINLNYSN